MAKKKNTAKKRVRGIPLDGEALARYRLQKGLSQEALAGLIGAEDPKSVQRAEAGAPTTFHEEIAKALGVHPTQLLKHSPEALQPPPSSAKKERLRFSLIIDAPPPAVVEAFKHEPLAAKLWLFCQLQGVIRDGAPGVGLDFSSVVVSADLTKQDILRMTRAFIAGRFTFLGITKVAVEDLAAAKAHAPASPVSPAGTQEFRAPGIEPGAEKASLSALSPIMTLLRAHDVPLGHLSVQETESAVILHGTVPTERLREIAAQAVKPTLAGREFHNNLEVVSSAEPQSQTKPQDVSAKEASVERPKGGLSIQRQRTTATVRLFGRWYDDIKVHEARAALANLIQEGVTQIVMDLSHCSNLSTSAMQIFFSCHRLLIEKGGKMKILAPQPDVMQVFEMLRADEMFEIAFDEEPDALQSAEEPPTPSNESTKSP